MDPCASSCQRGTPGLRGPAVSIGAEHLIRRFAPPSGAFRPGLAENMPKGMFSGRCGPPQGEGMRARPEGTRKRQRRNMEKKRGRASGPDVRCRGKAYALGPKGRESGGEETWRRSADGPCARTCDAGGRQPHPALRATFPKGESIRARPEGTRKRQTRNMEKKRGRALRPDVRCRGKAVMRWIIRRKVT